jgi:hypothetical protein
MLKPCEKYISLSFNFKTITLVEILSLTYQIFLFGEAQKYNIWKFNVIVKLYY